MRLKPGVRILDMRPEIAVAMIVCKSIVESYGAEFVVTSVKDGRHMHGSLHYEGMAMDVRSKSIPADKRVECRDRMKESLGDEFDVLLEQAGTPNEHLHVEFDPK